MGITTFNRPITCSSSCARSARRRRSTTCSTPSTSSTRAPSRATDQPGFADAAKKLGDRLQVIEQGNIGGSGGFARSMDETVRAGRSDYLLIMDDDVKLEPEGILRAATFADLARKPTIVGGHMFSLYDRSVLHAFAEAVAPHNWWWGAAPNTKARHDFGRRNLRNTPWLHRRADSDYNGWWMCLIPTQIIAEIGLALPVVHQVGRRRVRGAGPRPRLSDGVAAGSGAWQVPWEDKNDARDWQAYYHLRNRIVTALLHSPADHGGALISESLQRQLQNLLSMQYSTAALQAAGDRGRADRPGAPAPGDADQDERSCGSSARGSPTPRTRPTSRASRRRGDGRRMR